MDSALIVTSGEKGEPFFRQLLRRAKFRRIDGASTAGAARRCFQDGGYDLCVVNSPLPDEGGLRLACDFSEESCQVILIVSAQVFDETAAKAEEHGVLTLAKPLSADLVWNTLWAVRTLERRLETERAARRVLERRLEDLRVVERAKWLLVSHLSMTEPEAHRAIERQAMDLRVTRREVAEEILRTYEN